MTQPDIFRDVHQALRMALFEVTTALGRAHDDPKNQVRKQLSEVLYFVAHHGENEDVLLLPWLDTAAPALAEKMRLAHRALEPQLLGLRQTAATAPLDQLYRAMAEFTGHYLLHLHDEENLWEPEIRRVLSAEQLGQFGPQSVARTPPQDQPMMLRWMYKALPDDAAQALVDKLPPTLARAVQTP